MQPAGPAPRQPGPATGSRMDGATVPATSDLPDAPVQ